MTQVPPRLLLSIALVAYPFALSGQESADENGSALIWITGAGILAVGLFDIATAPLSARRHNANALALTPVIDVPQRRYGLAISLSLGTSLPAPTTRALPRRRFPGMTSELKSPSQAFLWSAGATFVPSGAGLLIAAAGNWNNNMTTLTIGVVGISSGLLLGPGAGHWYAGQQNRAWITTGIRFGLAVIGYIAATECCLAKG